MSVVEVGEGKVVLRLENGDLLRVGLAYFELLDGVRRYRSLSRASRETGVTLKTSLKWIRYLESKLGYRLVERRRGGRGGGGSELTEQARRLLEGYYSARATTRPGFITTFLESFMSARNILKCKVRSIKKSEILSLIEVELEPSQNLKALLTTESVERLKIREGADVVALIKATEVLIASGSIIRAE
ncbi:MAG: TOBE domain-containing protein [Nitrososphaerota archaeon]|nr:TOBE domain-containing protein [Candidatus Calditenuaceae archaeon]MDW8073244.1 TOBE domain-containing protein [Nitrososphaerota archaeon]